MLAAEDSAKAKENFLANMSHEIRTPMNAIIGFSNIISKTQLNDIQKEYIKAIQTSSENLLSIINDILDYSKIEAGMMTFEQITFSVRSLFASVEMILKSRAEERHNELKFVTDKNVPELLIGDPTRLTQILINLANNAIKFTEEGKVTLTAEARPYTNDKLNVFFKVTDTGIGIPPSKINSIFERFTQASMETSRKYGGTGLGLSIVYNLIKYQGGEIEVESQLGKGSVFTFYIPYKIPDDAEINKFTKSVNTIPLHRSMPNLNVLLVEDNKMNQRLAEIVLHEFGFNVTIANNGLEALTLLENKVYDIVLMDIQMPEMDGYEAAQRIRNKLNLKIPIIAMTAHAMEGEREKCLTFGMNDYISKPFKPDELYQTISNNISIQLSSEKPVRQPLKEQQTPANKYINIKQLETYVHGNKALVKEMVGAFLNDLPNNMKNFALAIKKQDFNSIRVLAHSLRGHVSLFGLETLMPMLTQIEQKASEQKEMNTISELFNQVNQICKIAISELEVIVKANNA